MRTDPRPTARGRRPHVWDESIPRRQSQCKHHGTTEFALYQKANGNGSPGWRCMACRAEASARVNTHKRNGEA